MFMRERIKTAYRKAELNIMTTKYDKKDKNSIIEYAQRAKGKKISELIDADIQINLKDKGLVGNLIQELYFGIPRNSYTEPDFEEAGIELKSFGYWDEGSLQKADQRLALSKIDFMEFENELPFSESHLYHKCHTMLLLAFLLEQNQARIDSEIKYVRLYEFDKLVKSDFEQILKDYNAIAKKIRDGKASSLSEGDTEFLGAARTGDKNSNLEEAPKKDRALPRRFALKQSYMSYLVREYFIPEKEFNEPIPRRKGAYQIRIPRGKSFEEWLNQIDAKYVGKTVKRISKLKAIKGITGAVSFYGKSDYSRIGLAMLGIKSNKDAYLQKTNTVVKSVRISKTGIMQESLSFPNFCVEDIQNQEWEESEVFLYLSEQRMLMQIFVESDKRKDEYIYKGHLFLKFTPEQLDKYVKRTWEAFKRKVIEGMRFEVVKNKNSFKVRSDVSGKTKGQIGLIKLHATDVAYDIDCNHISGADEAATKILEANTQNGRFVCKPENRDKYGCTLPNGDVITKQSFWLNNDFVLDYIRQNKPEILPEKRRRTDGKT